MLSESDLKPVPRGATMVSVLAIETSHGAGGVALLDDERLVAERRLADDARSARMLAPEIETLLGQSGVDPARLGLIAVGRGPGSFTGLRIGITTAKTLAWTLGIPLVAVETTDVLAAQAITGDVTPGTTIRVAIDAFRQEVFSAEFMIDESRNPRRVGPTRLESISQWLAGCRIGTLSTGPIVTRLQSQMSPDARLVAEDLRVPLARFVGRMAYQAFLTENHDDPFQLTPLYLRPSYAEEVHMAK